MRKLHRIDANSFSLLIVNNVIERIECDAKNTILRTQESYENYLKWTYDQLNKLLLNDYRNMLRNHKDYLKINCREITELNILEPFKAKQDDNYQYLYAAKYNGTECLLKLIIPNCKIKRVISQAYFHARLNGHENIIKCFGYTKIDNAYYLVLERVTATLDAYLSKNLSLKEKLEIIIGIGKGLAFMQMKNIVFNNISP